MIGYRQYKRILSEFIINNIQKEMDLNYTCDVCLMEVSSSEDICPFCQGVPPLKGKLTSKIQCLSCGIQNQLMNVVCIACEHQLFSQPKKLCQICGFQVNQSLFQEHKTNCLLSKQLVDSEKKMMEEQEAIKKNSKKCKYCSQIFPSDLIDQHYKLCEKAIKKPQIKPIKKPEVKPIKKPEVKKPQVKPIKKPPPPKCGKKMVPPPKQEAPLVFKPPPPLDDDPHNPDGILEMSEMKRMTKLQNTAILYMHKRSEQLHNKNVKNIQEKASKLGFKNEDVENFHFYIENYAPIIIHVHITRHMQFFIKDTHYRSQFQTNKSSGSLSRSSRTQWEDRMFDKKYSQATDYQRVKYGVINFTNDPKGVNCALGYGQSYFLLKNHVRSRCTFTDKDSSGSDSVIGTFKYPFHVMNKATDQELKSAFNAAKALQESSSVTRTYKEMQIHGPIEFSKDIERLYVNKNEVKDKNFLDMVYKFNELYGVDYEFI